MDIHSFFENEVKPALGCTEPGAVAYAAAAAARHLVGPVESILVRMSVPIYKNGRSVKIPGTGGLRGAAMAAALGSVGGNPDRGLTALSDLTKEQITAAISLCERGMVIEAVEPKAPAVWVEVTLISGPHSSVCTISNRHDAIERITADGRDIVQAPHQAPAIKSDPLESIKKLDFAALWNLATAIDGELVSTLLAGVEMNLAAAEEGVRHAAGLRFGDAATLNAQHECLSAVIMQLTGAASDMRMSGGSLPVMSSAGSGNHGITAIVPVAVVARWLKSSDRKLAEAVALSHLVCGYFKAFMGRLSPTCGCAVAAGAGAAAGIVRLLGGTPDQAERAVSTFTAALLGMICDGAKESCGLKVGVAGAEAYVSAMLVLENGGLKDDQGLVPIRLHELARVIEALNNRILAGTNQEMVDLLMELSLQQNRPPGACSV